MTEELNFKAICDIAINVCDVSKEALFSKTRKRPIQVVRASVSYIAMKEEDISRKVIAKILKRNRASTYHYERYHKKNFQRCKIYRDCFTKIYKEYKNIDGEKDIFINKRQMKNYLLQNGVIEKDRSDVKLQVKSGEVVCNIKTSYFDFSNQLENVKLAMQNYHYTVKII
jgi:transcriptional regulator